jgi:hypothetical protein
MLDMVGLVLFAVSESSRNTVFTYAPDAYHNDSDSEYSASIKSCRALLKTNHSVISRMTESLVKAFPAKVKGYVRENWGTPFITGFIIILLVAAASVVTGSEALANELANYAYFALVVGVVLHHVYFIDCTKRKGDKNYGPS